MNHTNHDNTRKMPRALRRFDLWLDTHLWYWIWRWTRQFDTPNSHHPFLVGLHNFALAKFSGYGFRYAWRMGMLWWGEEIPGVRKRTGRLP